MKRLVLRTAALVAALSVLGACGTDGGDDDSQGSMELTVGIAGPTPLFAPALIAEREGLFDKYGVDVKLVENTGGGALNAVVSGQVDISDSGAIVPLPAALGGKEVSVIFNTAIGGPSANVVGGKGITEVSQLDGTRVATPGEGTISNGWAKYYRDRFDVDFEIVPMPDAGSVAAAVASGSADAGVGLLAPFAAAIADKKADVLVDTRDAAQRKDALGEYDGVSEGNLFGVKRTLEGKHEAVVAFLKAYSEARGLLLDWAQTDPERVAKILQSFESFKGYAPAVLAGQVPDVSGYMEAAADGRITEDQWEYFLEAYQLLGVPGLKKDDPDTSYDAVVDMSYLDEALEK